MTKAELLQELSELMNQRRRIAVARYFTEDFRLDDAGAGVVRSGHVGAQTMLGEILSLAPDVPLEILDTVEAADRLAVRWRLTGTRTTGSFDVAMMAIYRFADGRIAEDWGVWSGKPWHAARLPDTDRASPIESDLPGPSRVYCA
jgi:predicted SnoaL-like aldol condensation-catalyzing enzyme